MDKITFTRLELYELVWKHPIGQIQIKYNVTRAGIKHACLKMDIPVPKSSYWLKNNYGREWKRELSVNYKGITRVEISVKKYEMQFRRSPKISPLRQLSETIRNDMDSPLNTPVFSGAQKVVIKRTGEFWRQNLISRTNAKDLTDVLFVRVSKSCVERALAILDLLIKLIEFRGHRFEVQKGGRGAVRIQNKLIHIHLRETIKRIPPPQGSDQAQYIFTGNFILGISAEGIAKDWRDSKFMLEEQLPVIMAKIELLAEEMDQKPV